MKRMMVMTACLVLCSGVSMAEDAKAQKKAEREASVQQWMDLQRSGEQASSVAQTLTPVIQERVVKRYLDSFNAPIPVFFVDASSSSASSVSR